MGESNSLRKKSAPLRERVEPPASRVKRLYSANFPVPASSILQIILTGTQMNEVPLESFMCGALEQSIHV